nr:hypothetical protein [Deltaproteobacteria bacterium]
MPVLAALCVPLLHPGEVLRARLRRVASIVSFAVPFGVYLIFREGLSRYHTPTVTLALTDVGSLRLTLLSFHDWLGLLAWSYLFCATRTDTITHAVSVAALVAAGYAAAIVVAWRRGAEGIAAGLLFFAVALVPSTAAFTGRGAAQVMAERYLYLPSVGLTLALAFALRALVARVGGRPTAAIVGALAVALGAATHARNEAWHSHMQLFRADAEAHPPTAT